MKKHERKKKLLTWGPNYASGVVWALSRHLHLPSGASAGSAGGIVVRVAVVAVVVVAVDTGVGVVVVVVVVSDELAVTCDV